MKDLFMSEYHKHIEHSILAKPFSNIYKINKYWGRKPWNIYRAFIQNYSKEDSIVLDPFCGSGVSVIESLKLPKRKVIGFDINPYAIFLTEQSITPLDLLDFEFTFHDVISEIEDKIKEEYTTPCRSCGKMADVIHYVWGREPLPKGTPTSEGTKRELQYVKYVCQSCGEENQITPVTFDFDLLFADYRSYSERIIAELDAPLIGDLKTTRKSEANSYYDLFTDRNLYLILTIFKAISSVESGRLKDAFKCVLLSSLAQSSKLLMYTKKGTRIGFKSKSWVAPRFHIQRNFLEKNPLLNFKNSFTRNYNAKRESNKLLLDVRLATSLDDIYSGKANVLLRVDNGKLLDEIADSTIHYVITDPPFMKSIKYLELSQLWNNFLGYNVDWDNEIKLQSKSKKSVEEYSESLRSHFVRLFDLMEEGQNFTLNYQLDDIDLWDAMIKIPTDSGFKLENISLQGTRYSYGARYRELYANRDATVPFFGAYYFTTFSKRRGVKRTKTPKADPTKELLKKSKDIIIQRREPTPFIIILKAVLEHLAKLDYKLPGAHDVLSFLEKRKNLFKIEGSGNDLWLNWSIKNIDMGRADSLSEQIKKEISETIILKGERGVSYLVQRILNKFSGDFTVGANQVKFIRDQILTENFISKNAEGVLQRRHDEINENVVNLGIKYNYDVYNITDNVEKYIHGTNLRNDIKKNMARVLKKLSPKRIDVFWGRNGRLLIYFHIILAKRNLDYIRSIDEIISELKVPTTGLRKIIIVPKHLKENYLEKAEEHWDYILLEDFEKFLYEENIIPRASIFEEEDDFPQKKIYKVKARVVQNERYAINGEIRYCKLVLRSGDIEECALAGNFVNVLCPIDESHMRPQIYSDEIQWVNERGKIERGNIKVPFLRRPFSIHRIHYKKFDPSTLRHLQPLPPPISRLVHPGKRSLFDILFKVVGVGTTILANVKQGSHLDIIGPLGNRFKINDDLTTALLVSGGIGVAPLYALAERLVWEGKRVKIFLGAFDKEDLKFMGYEHIQDISFTMPGTDSSMMLAEFKNIGVDVRICTVTGQVGEKALVTDMFLEYLSENRDTLNNTEVFSCGPKEMLRKLAAITKNFKLPHQVLLEEYMGCGVGACMSCVCPLKSIDGSFEYKRVCKEGPVFNSNEVAWDVY